MILNSSHRYLKSPFLFLVSDAGIFNTYSAKRPSKIQDFISTDNLVRGRNSKIQSIYCYWLVHRFNYILEAKTDNRQIKYKWSDSVSWYLSVQWQKSQVNAIRLKIIELKVAIKFPAFAILAWYNHSLLYLKAIRRQYSRYNLAFTFCSSESYTFRLIHSCFDFWSLVVSKPHFSVKGTRIQKSFRAILASN